MYDVKNQKYIVLDIIQPLLIFSVLYSTTRDPY